MASNKDVSDEEEWQGGLEVVNKGGGSSSRYPIHDAAEFEDVEALRQLIFVPQSDDDDESSISSEEDNSASSSSTLSNHHDKQQHDGAIIPPLLKDPSSSDGAVLFHETVAVSTPHLGDGGDVDTPLQLNNGSTAVGKDVVDGFLEEEEEEAKSKKETFEQISQKNCQDGDMKVETSASHLLQTMGNKSDGCAKQTSTSPPGATTDQEMNADETIPKQSNMKDAIEKKERMHNTKFSCPYDLDERDDDENTPLHIAIHARKIDNVRILLEAGASVHKKCDGSAPIHLAISLGAIAVHAEFAKSCVVLLREYNADLTMRDDSFHTPLYLACTSNLCPVVEMLLTDPLSKETLNLKADRTGGRALHAAAKCDDMRSRMIKNSVCVTELLLAADNIDVNVQNNYGRTPLHIAASRGNWHVARLLINAGADVHILDKRGFSPGQRAVKRGMVIPNDLKVLGSEAPTRDLIMDPDGSTLLLCHELCIQHRTCPPIVRGDAESSEPP